MKVNREQFLAAAILFASTTGCGKLTDKMHGYSAAADPAAGPVAATPTPAGGNVNGATMPAGFVERDVHGNPVATPAQKQAVNAKAPAKEGGVAPAKENFGPSSENTGPARENWGPAKENVGPSRERWGPSKENVGPSRERSGPARENTGPSNENFHPKRKT